MFQIALSYNLVSYSIVIVDLFYTMIEYRIEKLGLASFFISKERLLTFLGKINDIFGIFKAFTADKLSKKQKCLKNPRRC